MAGDIAVGVTIGATVGAAYRRAFLDAKTRLKNLGDAFEEANKRLTAAGAVLKYKRELDDLRRKQGTLGEAEKKALAAAEKRFETAKRAAQQYGIEVGQAAAKHKELTKAVGRMQGEMAARQRMEGAKGGLTAMRGHLAATAGVGYAFARMAGQAMAREEQAQYLRTVINAPDKDAAVDRALEHAREFSRRSLASDAEVLDIQYALNSAGLAEDVARAGTEVVHRLATVTRGSAVQVGEVFGVAMNNMAAGMEGTMRERMDRIANVLAKTQFKYQIRDFGQLGESMKYASADAVSAQVPLEQTAAAIGALNSAGLEGSMAGTAFARMLAGFSKVKDDLGVDVVRDARGDLDLVATLRAVQAEISAQGLDTDQRSELLRGMFGDEGQRAVIPLLADLDRLAAGVGELRDAGGSNLVAEEYGRLLEGGGAQWKMLGQNVRQVGEIFAHSLLPEITRAVGWLGRMAGRVSGAIERYPILGRLVGALALGVGLVTVAFGGAAAAIWLVNAAMLANPIGITVAAIVAGAALIYSLWDPITEEVGALWEKLKSLGQTLREIGDAMKNSAIGKAVRKLFGVEVDEDEALPGQAATTAGAGRGRRRRRNRAAAVGLAATVSTVAAAPAEAARIEAELAAARKAATTPPELEGSFDVQALTDNVAALDDRFSRTPAAAPPPPALESLPPPPPPPAASRGPTTITVTVGDVVIQAPAGADPADVASEVRREMEAIMREASVEAGLAEHDGAF